MISAPKSSPNSDPRRDVRSAKLLSGAKILQEQFSRIFEDGADPWAQYPEFLTGARAYITVAGRPYAVAIRVQYRVSMEVEEVRTVDTNLPWEIIPGQVHIHATLQGVIDPTQPAESDGLWANMASIMHQPLVEIEVLDKLGEKQFWARGMFTEISNSIAVGSVAERTATFRGIAYAHNVMQSFTPYADDDGIAGKITGALKSASSWVRNTTGGAF
jgi:hypothetical protein